MGLSWVNSKVQKINTNNFRLPHVGWNKLKIIKKSLLLDGISNDTMFYFNHSYCIYKKKNQNFARFNFSLVHPRGLQLQAINFKSLFSNNEKSFINDDH